MLTTEDRTPAAIRDHSRAGDILTATDLPLRRSPDALLIGHYVRVQDSGDRGRVIVIVTSLLVIAAVLSWAVLGGGRRSPLFGGEQAPRLGVGAESRS